MNQPEKGINKELEDITCLYEITKALASPTDLRDSLEHIMKILSGRKRMHNGTVTIINPLTGQLEIEIAHGMSAEARKRGKYKVGEGITGRVVATGQPIVIPHIGEETGFLNRTRTRGDISTQHNSFLCVPIQHDKRTLGALSIDLEYKEDLNYEEDLRSRKILNSKKSFRKNTGSQT
jgi:Nif-specific regulatory protein